MQPNWAVVCGLVRDPAAAMHQAEWLARFRAEGLIQGVVVSTWAGELDRYPEVRQAFAALDAVVVTSLEPALKTPGYVLHQSKAILLGLQACPADAMVLKMRFDLGHLGDALRPVLSGERLAAQERRARPSLFSRPVLAHSGLMFWPLFLNDIFYYGARADVAKIGGYDIDSEIFFNDLGAEQYFHLPPFARKYPTLSLFARIQKGLEAGVAPSNRVYTDILLDSDFWYRVWAIYARILLEDYYVGLTDEIHALSPEVLDAYGRFTLGELSDVGERLPFLRSGAIAGTLEVHSVTWAMAAVQGLFKPDAALERFQAAYADVSAGDELNDSAAFPHPDAVALTEKIAAAFPAYRHKVCTAPAGERDRDLGFPQERFQMAAQEDTRALEDEISSLRRRYEEALMKRAV